MRQADILDALGDARGSNDNGNFASIGNARCFPPEEGG